MERKQRSYSILRRISFGMAAIYIAFLVLMLVNNFYAIDITQQRIYNQIYDMLNQQNRQITSELSEVSTYLASFSGDAANLKTVERNRKDNDFYSAVYKLRSDLKRDLMSMSILHGLFIFPSSNQLFITAAESTQSEIPSYALRVWMREHYARGNLDDYRQKSWFALELDDRYYLIRFLKIGDSYVGAWTDFSRLLSRVENSATLEQTVLFSLGEQGTYTVGSVKANDSLPGIQAKDTMQIVYLNEQYLSVNVPAGYTTNGAITVLVPSRQITAQLLNSYLLMLFTSAVFIILALVAVVLVMRYLKRPIIQLKVSLDALKEGNFSTRVSETEACREFISVNSAFNQMVERIEGLKIDVYEEKLVQQRTEMQALKNQIAPHFLINCLYAIFNMANTGDYDNIRKLASRLGDHLRYTLADTSTVSLQDELDKVVNYVELSKLRYPGSIELVLEISETAADTPVLPMLILFQVENCIKYEVVQGAVTEIHVEAYRVRNESSERLQLCIWDTGSGYSQDVLEQLNSGAMLSQAEGRNIGTKNVNARLRLMFDGDFTMRFSNRENAGAQIDIDIPVTTATRIG